jgi:hypothetical protein
MHDQNSVEIFDIVFGMRGPARNTLPHRSVRGARFVVGTA